jgi:hypothetical protein
MGRMMRNFIESDKVKELFKQVPPGTVEAIGQSNTPLGNLLKGSGVAYPQQQTQTYAPLVQLQQPLPPLQFDNPERAERIESSLGRAAFGPERIREILMQLKEANFLANGGRVGYIGGGLATTQDYATALSKVGAGTQEQKNRQVQDYARSEASSQIANALQGGQSSLDSYLTNVFGQGTPATTSGKYASYNSPFTGIFRSTRNQMIDDVAQQLVQKQAPSFYSASKPIPKTYRTVSPEAQALNMSQSTYEDIIRSGADPKQYYIDYHNRIMADANNPNLLKYGQVLGVPGMDIAGPPTPFGASSPTQAQINQMMQNNPTGYTDFADLVKKYSADPYKSLQEEIRDMVDGRDTGYMSGQDYYDTNVLGLDGRGIAEKYGLQYADGGLATLFSMKR